MKGDVLHDETKFIPRRKCRRGMGTSHAILMLKFWQWRKKRGTYKFLLTHNQPHD